MRYGLQPARLHAHVMTTAKPTAHAKGAEHGDGWRRSLSISPIIVTLLLLQPKRGRLGLLVLRRLHQFPGTLHIARIGHLAQLVRSLVVFRERVRGHVVHKDAAGVGVL